MNTKDEYSEKFKKALLNEDLQTINTIPKSDHHVHIKYGGTLGYFSERGIFLEKFPEDIYSIRELQLWQKQKICPFFNDISGTKERIKATFIQAQRDNIKNISLAIGLSTIMQFKDIQYLFEYLYRLKEEYISNSICNYELMLDKKYDNEFNKNKVVPLLKKKYFSAIDCGGIPEKANDNIKVVYDYATENGIRKKAHIGEFSDPAAILETVKCLNLDEIVHGIRAVESKETMDFLREKKVYLHICPESNIKLHAVRSYYEHPIKKIYRSGIGVTINTDDLLLFNASVSEQYLKLYKNMCLTAEELDKIRVFGLKKRL